MLISEKGLDNKKGAELCNNHNSNSSFISSESDNFQSTAGLAAKIRVCSM